MLDYNKKINLNLRMIQDIAKVEEVKMFRLFVYIGTLLLGSAICGYSIGIYSACHRVFREKNGWTEDGTDDKFWNSLLTTLMPLGAAIGAILSSPVIKFGRRIAVLIGDVCAIVSALAMINVGSLTSVCVGRFVLGIGVGLLSSAVPLYINELLPRGLTGALGSCHQLLMTGAIFVASVVGILLKKGLAKENVGERFEYCGWVLAGTGFLGALQMIIVHFGFEFDSPTFYMEKEDRATAREAVETIYADPEGVNEKMEQLIRGNEQQASSGDGGELYQKYKMALIVGIALAIFQQLTGINIVIMYAPTVFRKVGEGIEDYLTAGAMFTNFAATLLAVFFVDRVGRKMMLIIGSMGCATTLLICAMSYNDGTYRNVVKDWVFAVSVYAFIILFEISHGPICWLYLSEVLFSRWMGYATAASWIFTILVSSTTTLLLQDPPYGYATYFVFMIDSALFCVAYVKETKGKSKAEIVAMFDSYRDELPLEEQNDEEDEKVQ